MSGDPEQDYFADGIVDDIITALTRMRWFFVIARNSSFTYKGRAVYQQEAAVCGYRLTTVLQNRDAAFVVPIMLY
jgi:TolB-like protein